MDENPFGVLEFLHWNHPWNNYKYSSKEDLEKAVSMMKESGVGWVRMDFLWQDIEPEEGRFDFEKYDYIVELLYKNGINLLGILDYTADWASSCGKWNCPAKDNGLFLNYVTKVVGRYKDKVKHWEFWNEPDSHIYWETQDELKSYCALLKRVYETAKMIDPDCKILNGGFANGILSVNRLYDNGAKDYFDILNIHVFDSPRNAGAVKRILSYPKLAHKIMSRNGDSGKKIWITEIGCPGVKRGQKVKNWWMGENPGEEEQARWVEQVYEGLNKSASVEKIFWAFFRDTDKHWNDGTDYFGLIRSDFSRKSSFTVYKKCSASWKEKQ